MANENQVQAEAAAEAPAKIVEAIADTAEKVVAESKKVAKRTRATTARRVKREAAAEKAAVRRSTRRTIRKTRTTARKTASKAPRAAQQRIDTVTNTNFFNGFDAVPAFAPFQNMFADANERSQDLAKRTEGARSIGQNVVAKQRGTYEQAADAIRSLAEAKSPTEYLQLQSEFARQSFDRAVAESSKLTESLVKLAGEAFQPLSNRATANAERFNTLVA